MKILFLSNWLPYPPDNGSKLRISNLLNCLALHHQVSLVSFSDHAQPGEIPQLPGTYQRVRIVPTRVYNAKSARAVLGFFSPRPRVLVDRFEPLMAEAIENEIYAGQYDLVIASQWYMADYYQVFRKIPAIFEELEVGVFTNKVARADNPLQRLRHGMTTLKLQFYLRDLLSNFDATTVVSETELDLVRKMAPGYRHVEVIPNGVNLDDYQAVEPSTQPETLIFTGSLRFFPNYEAMRWFLREVYPRIRAEVPGVRLTITGDSAGRSLPQAENIIQTGFVEDIRPLVAASWISIAPIFSGGGTRLKILEAMALRTPVIATSKGAEGLEANPEEHLLLADTPQAFSEAAIRLIKDPSLRRRLVDNAYQLVREKYDWEVILPKFLQVVERAAAGIEVPPGLPGL